MYPEIGKSESQRHEEFALSVVGEMTKYNEEQKNDIIKIIVMQTEKNRLGLIQDFEQRTKELTSYNQGLPIFK